MVEIRITIEGGVLEHSNLNTSTINNSQVFREAFQKLLSKFIDTSKFKLSIDIGAGYKNAVKFFVQHTNHPTTNLLLIDLDGTNTNRHQRLEELALIPFEPSIFFMVQEMEAWILSQPHKLEELYSNRYERKQKEKRLIELEPDLFTKNPIDIVKPSEKLAIIISRYFVELKGDQPKKKKYGKLKDAPLLLENLDATKLLTDFEDVKRLSNLFKNL